MCITNIRNNMDSDSDEEQEKRWLLKDSVLDNRISEKPALNYAHAPAVHIGYQGIPHTDIISRPLPPMKKEHSGNDIFQKTTHRMTYDEVFNYTGQFGVFQICIYIMAIFWGMMMGYDVNTTIFLGFSQPHWCEVTRLANISYDEQRYIAIPWDESKDDFHRCKVHIFDTFR